MQDAACVGRAVDPGARTWTGIPGLDAAAGSMDVPLDEGGVSDNGGRDARPPRRGRRARCPPPKDEDGGFASRAPLGAIASGPLGPGSARVATLTLNVAAVPGTHNLWIACGGYQPTTAGAEAAFMAPGPILAIQIGGA